jgi:uncharacterized protein YerC
MKVKIKELTDEERIETLDALYTAAGTVRGREAMKLFLRDLLTESERVMLGRRILIARRLLSGSLYDDIANHLRVGHDTIHRVHRWLRDKLPGYEHAIRDMEKEFQERARRHEDKRLYATSALYRLKKKYPMHFLLFPPWPKQKR